MNSKHCFHCGNYCNHTIIPYDNKIFCCNGCKTVYEIFSENDLSNYYNFQEKPGSIPTEIQGKYDFLDHLEITEKLLDFSDENTQVATLFIPQMHCSSCIWVLENIHKLNPGVIHSQVDFPKKTVRITFHPKEASFKEIVVILGTIGYEPSIHLEEYEREKKVLDRSLLYQLGIAGFAFGNVMFLSFPEYFEVDGFWIEKYKITFRWLMFFFSLPVVFYAGKDYFISAYKGLRSQLLNIEVPIALGISVLFLRSVVEILFDLGSGFFDSLTGLVFFLLLGKYFQQKTYQFLSFERDYKSYFPIAVTRIKDSKEENVQIYKIQKGDHLLIRNQELIPVDGILTSGHAQIDYSFVTGEAVPVNKKIGDKLYAGGKQVAGVIEIEVLTPFSQSHITQLWSNAVFQKDQPSHFKTITDTISKNFTIGVLSIAILSASFWLYHDSSKALNVFTAVLIIACPCAIALAAPFTLGNLLRIFGKHKFYLKNTIVVEQLAKIDRILFDKTGTLTTHKENRFYYEGTPLTSLEKSILKSSLRASNHPLSRNLYATFTETPTVEIFQYREVVGSGIQARYQDNNLTLGSSYFVKNEGGNSQLDTSIHLRFGKTYKGKFTFKNSYRASLEKVFDRLKNKFQLAVVSGDNEGEKNYLQKILPKGTPLLFNQKPKDKLLVVENFQKDNQKVAMIGDGLNDAGALAQSDVGIALSENINVFSPACDAILDASQFDKIAAFMDASKKAIQIIKYCFILSLCYNSIGLYFAITGQLTPIIAAILMPISSISVVVFTNVATNYLGNKLNRS